MKNIEEFSKVVSDCFGIKYDSETENHYVFKLKAKLHEDFKDYVSTIDKNKFDQMLAEKKNFTKNVNSIEKEGYFECLVKNDKNKYRIRDIEKAIEDDEKTFEIGVPSVQLLTNSLFDLSNGVGRSAMNSFDENFNKNGEYFGVSRDRYDTLEQIRYLSNDLRSVKVTSQCLSIETLRNLAQSYLYEINSSFGEAFATVEVSIYDVFRSNQLDGPIRKRYDEISVPDKIYPEAILNYYQRALSTNNIEFQFLSFYQILEYFYDKYFTDEMSLELLESHTESPHDLNDASSRLEIIESIIKKYRKLDERGSLKIVLKKNIITKEDFKNKIDAVDDTLLEYLRNPWPGFLDFPSFDYDSLPLERIILLLSERIYEIRNEVTHRKSKITKYIPQKHERYLLYETRLLQIIVEIIINNNGKEYVSQH